jgi:hypothetical protein
MPSIVIKSTSSSTSSTSEPVTLTSFGASSDG